MKSATIFLVALAAIGWQSPAANAQVRLEQKVPENTTYTSTVETQSIQTLNLNGQDIDTNVSQTMTIENTSGQRSADGKLQVEHKVTGLRTQMTLPGLGDVTFDSTKPDEATDSPFTPVFKATAESSWQTVVDKENKILSVKGREGALNGLDESVKTLIEGQFNPEYLTESAKVEAARIPDTPVNIDDTWELSHALRVDSSQILTYTKEYTYRGQEDFNGKKLDRIDVKATGIKYEILPGGPIPLKLTKSDLKIGETSGKFYFDRELGRVVFDEQSHQVVGDLTLDINGMEFPSTLDLRMITRVREE